MEYSIFFVLTSLIPTLDGQINKETDKTEWLTDIENNKGTHTVLVEQGTATTCVYCPSMEQYLWQVSGDLEIVALPCAHYTPSQGYTQAITDRLIELGMVATWIPSGTEDTPLLEVVNLVLVRFKLLMIPVLQEL